MDNASTHAIADEEGATAEIPAAMTIRGRGSDRTTLAAPSSRSAAEVRGASTQVSLDPPPWLELTTREPSTSATRVSPPGSTHTSLPSLTANGLRST